MVKLGAEIVFSVALEYLPYVAGAIAAGVAGWVVSMLAV
jgi:hypothetical protein